MDYGLYYTKYPSILKDFHMLVELLIKIIIQPQVVGYLFLVEELFHEAQRSKLI